MVKTIKIAYCKICNKEVKPGKKKMGTWEKIGWVIVATFSLGLFVTIPYIGIAYVIILCFIFLLYRFRLQKKKYCPVCNVVVTFKTEEEKAEEEKSKTKFDTSTAKGRVLEKVEHVKKQPKAKPKKEAEKDFCEFCGSQIPSSASVCPSCKTKLNK